MKKTFYSLLKIVKKYQKIFFAVVGVVIFLFIVYKTMRLWNGVKSNIHLYNSYYLAFSIVLMTAFSILLSNNWTRLILYLLPKQNLHANQLRFYYSKSQLARYIPGGIWNYVGRFVFLKKLGDEGYGISVQSTIVETVLLVISSLLVGILFSSGLLNHIEVIAIMIVLSFLGILMFNIEKFIKIFNSNYKNKQIHWVPIKKISMLKLLFKYCLMWSCASLGFAFLVVSTFEVGKGQFLSLSASFPIAWCFGFLTPMPGGIGTREIVQIFFLSKQNTSEIAYFIATASRLFMILCEVVSFGIIFLWSRRVHTMKS